MGERGFGDLTLGQHIVADRVRGVEPFLEVALVDPVLVAPGPDPGIAIRLKLHRHLERVGLAPVGLLGTAHFVRHAEQLLDVVAVFVRDHIVAGEIATRTKALLQLLVEIGVEVDALILRAIERPHRALRGTAARLAGLRIEHQLGRGERDLGGLEQRGPGFVERRQRVAAFAADRVDRAALGGVAAALGRHLTRPGFLHPAEHLPGIDPEHQRGDQRDHDAAAADASAGAAQRKPAAALILDVHAVGIEIVEPHVTSPCWHWTSIGRAAKAAARLGNDYPGG